MRDSVVEDTPLSLVKLSFIHFHIDGSMQVKFLLGQLKFWLKRGKGKYRRASDWHRSPGTQKHLQSQQAASRETPNHDTVVLEKGSGPFDAHQQQQEWEERAVAFNPFVIEFIGGPFDGLRRSVHDSNQPESTVNLPVSAAILRFVIGEAAVGEFEATSQAFYALSRRGACWKYDFVKLVP